MSNTQMEPPAVSATATTTTQPQTQPQTPAPQSLSSQLATLKINTGPPVDQDGAFLQDRVLKSGWLHKRTRKTKGWKRRWFVLRADRLSCYKDQKEYKIHRQIYLSDVTAVTVLKDPKQKHPPFAFGVFTNSKNFHFRSESEEETKDWTEKIWAAVAQEVPGDMMLSSPIAAAGIASPPLQGHAPGMSVSASKRAKVFGAGVGNGGRVSSQTLDYSGPDVGSVSSLSDAARVSQLSLAQHHDAGFLSGGETTDSKTTSVDPPRIARNGSGYSSTEQLPRVIWHGYLYCLKSKGGVKQWKRYWIVVRNINIGFYKNEEEYRAIKILPLDSVVDAVEIDPLSRSRRHCLQIISESKAYRFSAPDEEVLVKVLGALKSTLAKSKAPLPPTPPPTQAPSVPAPAAAAAAAAPTPAPAPTAVH